MMYYSSVQCWSWLGCNVKVQIRLV